MHAWWFFLFPMALARFEREKSIEFWNRLARENVASKVEKFKEMHDGRAPKNIILFIGDGMGSTSLAATRIYKAEKKNQPGNYSKDPFFMETFESTGWSKTASWSAHVTDSAAGAVALMVGLKGENGALGTRPGEYYDCSPKSRLEGENAAELAIEKGLSVGVVTTMSVTHATPGAVYAKGIYRKQEADGRPRRKRSCEGQDIAMQLLRYPANRFTVIMGGGREHMRNQTLQGTRVDGSNVEKMWKELPGKRKILYTRDELLALNMEDPALYVMGLFDDGYMEPQAIYPKKEPLLSEMTASSIKLLSQNKKGYFLMVEGGQIDSFEHGNVIRLQSEEVLEFDDAIKMARQMTNKSETLIIVTADHSHAVAVGEFESKKSKITDIEETKKGVAFAYGPGYYASDRGSPDSLEYMSPALFFAKNGFHGGDHVPIYADGPYSWLFSSTIQNTEIGYLMKYLLCLKEDCVSRDYRQKASDIENVYLEKQLTKKKDIITEVLCRLMVALAAMSMACTLFLFFQLVIPE